MDYRTYHERYRLDLEKQKDSAKKFKEETFEMNKILQNISDRMKHCNEYLFIFNHGFSTNNCWSETQRKAEGSFKRSRQNQESFPKPFLIKQEKRRRDNCKDNTKIQKKTILSRIFNFSF